MRGIITPLIAVLLLSAAAPALIADEHASRPVDADEPLGLPLDDESFNDEWFRQSIDRLQISPQTKELLDFLKTIPNRDHVLNFGESLVYSVRYGPLRAGETVITLTGVEVVDGDSCYHVVATAETNDFVSAFFHVRDRMESYLDIKTLLPLYNEKTLLEGDYQNNQAIDFDQKNHIAFYDDGGVFDMQPNSHDVLSSFINLRMHDLIPGMSYDLENHVDRKNYPIRFNVIRRERVKVPAGEYECVVVQPIIRTPKLFQHKGKIWIWLTDDKRKIPVQMKSELVVGAFSIVLTEIKNQSPGESG